MKLDTKLNARSAEFQANASAMRALVDDLHAQFAKVEAGGGEAARSKHQARGKLLPRDRVAQLLDPGSPFLEIGQMAAHGMYDGDAPGAGVVTGIGRVQGVDCMMVANDATVKGGTYFPMTVKKHPSANSAMFSRIPASMRSWSRACAMSVSTSSGNCVRPCRRTRSCRCSSWAGRPTSASWSCRTIARHTPTQ